MELLHEEFAGVSKKGIARLLCRELELDTQFQRPKTTVALETRRGKNVIRKEGKG